MILDLQEVNSMTVSKRNILFAVNVIVPLICGLFIYLTKEENTFISSSLSGIRSVLPVIRYPVLIHDFAADFLWTYSLLFCLRLALGDEMKGRHNITVILVTSGAAVIIELLQLIDGFPGTFDIFDIVAELIAVAAGSFIMFLIERKVDQRAA